MPISTGDIGSLTSASDRQAQQLMEYLKGQQAQQQIAQQGALKTAAQAHDEQILQGATGQPDTGSAVGALMKSGNQVSLPGMTVGSGMPAQKMAMGQAHQFNQEATKAYAPLETSVSSARKALDQLDLKTKIGDSMALASEAQLAGGQSRGLAYMMKALSSKGITPSPNAKIEDIVNQYNNASGDSVMPDDVRNDIKSSIHARTPQLEQQHQQLQSQLSQQGAITAPNSDYRSLINSHASQVDANLAELKKREADWKQTKEAAGPTSNTGRIGGLLSHLFGPQAAAQGTPQQQQQVGPPSAPQQIKVVGGKRYTRGPNGEAIEVK